MNHEKYKATLKETPSNTTIYLNISKLKNGKYTLKIIHENKLLKQVQFKKQK